MQITISGKDITFTGFKNENRPVSKDEALNMLLSFYAKAKRIINES